MLVFTVILGLIDEPTGPATCPPTPTLDLTKITDEAFLEIETIKKPLELLMSKMPTDQIKGRDTLLHAISSEPLRSAPLNQRAALYDRLNKIYESHRSLENQEGSWPGRVYTSDARKFVEAWKLNQPLPSPGNTLVLFVTNQDATSMKAANPIDKAKKLKSLSTLVRDQTENSKFKSKGNLNDPRVQVELFNQIQKGIPVRLETASKTFLIIGVEYENSDPKHYFALEAGKEDSGFWKIDYEGDHRGGMVSASLGKSAPQTSEAKVSFLESEKLKKNFSFSDLSIFYVAPSENAPAPPPENSEQTDSPKK